MRSYALLGRLWQTLPVSVRRPIVRLTQQTYTVGVSATVLDQSGAILLLRHRFRESGGWELPGGFIRKGEEPARAIVRELAEETDLEIQVLGVARVDVERAGHLDVCFLARSHAGALRPDPTEIVEARFFPPDALPHIARAQRDSIAAARALLTRLDPLSPC